MDLKEVRLKKYSDSSHGWVAVGVKWLSHLGLENEISKSSLIRGRTAYLEEDSDAPKLLIAMEDAGYKPVIVESQTVYVRWPGRSYESYTAQRARKAEEAKRVSDTYR